MGPGRVVGVGEEDDPGARRDRLGDRLQVVREVPQRHGTRHPAGRLHHQPIDHERLVGHHRLIAHADEGADDELDDLVRAVADDDLVGGHAQALRQAALQVEGRAVRVAVQVPERGRDRGQRLGRRTERVLVGGELDGAVDPEVALELLDRHARRIRRERPDPFRDEAAQVHHISGAGAAG